MTTVALNNLWTYLQGLSLTQSDRKWLADKLIMPTQKTAPATKDEDLSKFLEMEGIWSESEEGEEYYQMMIHRNDGRPLNREINLDD
jgi:hypothetical protein